MLVRPAAIAALPGAPKGLVRQQIDQAGLTVDPDPRAPCGAELKNSPSLQHGALAVSANPANAVVTQWVNRLPGQRAAALIGAEIRDACPGCPDYFSHTDTGAVQLNHLVRVVPLAASLADQRLATVLRISPARGKPVYAATIDLRARACLMRVIVLANPGCEQVRPEARVLAGTQLGALDSVLTGVICFRRPGRGERPGSN
jgi:hypothetical protein